MIVLRQNRMVVVGRQEGYIQVLKTFSDFQVVLNLFSLRAQAEPLLAWLRQTARDYEAFIVAAR